MDVTFNSAPPATLVSQWTALVTFFMPFLVEMITQSYWGTNTKRIVAFAACMAATAIQLSFEQKLDFQHFMPTLLAIFSGSQILFTHFYKPLGIAGPLERVTDFKSPASNRSDADTDFVEEEVKEN